jgi:hypothetical protein
MIVEDPVSYLFGTPDLFAVFLTNPNREKHVEFHVVTEPELIIKIPLEKLQVIDHGEKIGIEFSGNSFSTLLRIKGKRKNDFKQFLDAELARRLPKTETGSEATKS